MENTYQFDFIDIIIFYVTNACTIRAQSRVFDTLDTIYNYIYIL